MKTIEKDLDNKIETILELFSVHPEFRPNRFKNSEQLKHAFLTGRLPNHPTSPKTVQDVAVAEIMINYFEYSEKEIDKILEAHKDCMASENIVGDILERFLASVLEPAGWVWCAGSTVRAIDFIKKENNEWFLLQIKTRDNSENSSSSAIREGTTIKKWFRAYSRKEKFNWDAFPFVEDIPSLKEQLTEENFRLFLRNYLISLKG